MNMKTFSRRDCMRTLAFAAVGGAMLRAEEPHVVVPAYNTLSDSEEIQLGRKFAAELEKSLPILDVGPLTSYVNSLVQQLGKSSQRPNLHYVAKVANTTDVNAVSLPGGYLYVFRGLLEMAQSESELVSVLGHEVGHIVGHHGANKLMLDFKARSLYELVKKNLELENSVIAQVIEKLGGPLVVLAQLKYGRENEFQADMLGCYEMTRAGWHPKGAIAMLQLLKNMEHGDSNWFDDILSTHPNTGERIERLRAEMATMRLSSNLSEDSIGFHAMKLGLKILPAPVKPQR